MANDTTSRSTAPASGAVGVTGRRKRHGLGWLPWLALLLLGLIGLGIFALMRNVADEGDSSGIDLSNDRSGGAQERGLGTDNQNDGTPGINTPTTGAGSTATTTAPATGSGSGAASAPLTGGGQDLLARAGNPSQLAAVSGQPAVGRGVAVQSVVADEGFWVGNSTTQRVFVFLTPQARTRAGESPFQVQAGQRVNLQGTVKPVPSDLTPFGVEANEGADQLRNQAQYVEATSISLG